MNDARCFLDAVGPDQLERAERRSRRWRLAALVCASLLGVILITGQDDPPRSETTTEVAAADNAEAAATPTWRYEVVRFPARPPFEVKGDVTRYLTDELNRGAAEGWEYVGLLALESQTHGYNGLVAFRRTEQ